MKFEYHIEKYSELGLIVKRGNTQNTVVFWDENEGAATYILELFRLSQEYHCFEYKDGFVQEAEIVEDDNALRCGQHLTTEAPGIVGNKFAVNQTYNGVHYNVLQFEFSMIKPVTTIQIERNVFYHSFNDLPCGDYIVCLKIENRLGETIAESTPYYFHINDA